MKRFLFFILLFATANAETVYTTTDSQGNTIYSDTPLNNAKIMIIPETNTVTSQHPASKTSTTSTPTATEVVEEMRKPYTSIKIESPEDQQTFQNQRDIPVKLKISPELQPGDKIQVYLDGKPSGDPVASTDQQVSQVERGTHTITAAVVDKSGGIFKVSQTVTIFIHYAALGTHLLP